MSKSLARVKARATELGLELDIRHLEVSTRSAAEAAQAVGCDVDQIAKSIIFRGASSNTALLFLTAGGNRVQEAPAASLAGEDLVRADAEFIRSSTGFAIGGVSPIGHTSVVRTWLDETLMTFDSVWAAAGTPNHMFTIAPAELLRATGAQVAAFTQD